MKTTEYTLARGRFYHSSIRVRILSVTSDMNPSETQTVYVVDGLGNLTCVVMPLAYMDIIFLSMLEMSFWHFLTTCGANID